ncbi:multiple epidermal growth factor-like domains protein 8 [Babylonia areolata]|uniref:multiple epidermal growth factor-like domains protein 8 n=1 Tax=Babylonia areolata TaxID=304850 RepID=UPI003FD2B595
MRTNALVPVVLAAASVCLGAVCFLCSAATSPTLNCSGRKVLNGDKGYISDGFDHYLPNSHCEWLIEAGSPNKSIHLKFKAMSTECSFDFLFIYDGDSYSSPLLATLSGDSFPHPVTARSGHMLLYLYSDRNYLKEGFEAYYFIYDCPWNCSNHGLCANHTCHCHPGYYGDGCQHKVCVDDCSGHGRCVPVSQTMRWCQCDEGYVGHSCNLSLNDAEGQGVWYSLQPSGTSFRSRTSHTAVFLEDKDCLWVFGGFDLNSVLNDLSCFCFHTNLWESMTMLEPWPAPRSDHAMAAYADGFFIFGGLLTDGSHSNELWFFNVTSEQWTVRAVNSSVTPHAVTGHTLTTVGQWLYLIGGKTEDRVSRDDVFRIDASTADTWEVVVIKGSRYPRKRLVGHSTIYHQEAHSLIVFGGYLQSSALFSDRTRQIHSLSLHDNYWSELSIDTWRDATVPKERAFHSAVRMGGYMVVFGGNTHDHSSLEICYNSRLYFYHLGCHVWLNHTYFSGPVVPKGRFGHVAAVARGNLMLVVGGYSGQVLDDLMVYKVPSAIAPPKGERQREEDHCERYRIRMLCLDDPECVFCNNGSLLEGVCCVHRSHAELCTKGDVQDSPDRCPGICPALHTCGACVSHGRGANLTLTSAPRQQRIHSQQCSWCVKEATCQTRSDPKGTCRAANQTRSGLEGWWGGLSQQLTSLLQCQKEDFPAGLHWIKYRNPKNLSFPDELSIRRMTSGTLGYVSTTKIESEFTYTARFVGFLHPLNARPPPSQSLRLYLGLSFAQARLYLGADETEESKEKIISMGKQTLFNQTFADHRPNRPLFPKVGRGHKYYIAQVTEQVPGMSKESEMQNSEVTIEWNGCLPERSTLLHHVITSEFLEPYSDGNCQQHFNCLGCLTDTLCSWCQVTRSCVQRNETNLTCMALTTNSSGGEGEVAGRREEEYYITSPSECPSCGSHVQCHTCAADPLCEWVAKNGHCTRRYRIEDAVRDSSKCRPPCHERQNCSECIVKTGQCVWCDNTQTCLPFSDYVTRYIYGQCTSWVDTIVEGNGCRDCSQHTTCANCLAAFGCGWCGNDDNPTLGLCVDGDFTGPQSNVTCGAVVGERYNLSVSEPASWSYDRCPDVEECRLGLHDCHSNATCHNSFDKYECHCNQGFIGDGRLHCEKTCFYECIHGNCSGPPDYQCQCQLGWTSPWCNESCDCNNHSNCSQGVGLCDHCQHRTTGPHCQRCIPGSYGNPADPEGCRPCDCNGHGDLSQGECHNVTGKCFCTHNTQGMHCDICEENYYGNPRSGGRCYRQCDGRLAYTAISEGGLGSYRGGGVQDPAHAYCLWILTVFHANSMGRPPYDVVRIISFTVEGDMQVECGQDAIQVYDGIPPHINGTSSSTARHLGSICGINPGRDITVHAYSGTVTVIFEANLLMSRTRGFNATYRPEVCEGDCATDDTWNWKCVRGKCSCPPGYFGPDCQEEICPNNCSAHKKQGSCDKVLRMCRCQSNFSGKDCSINIGANPHVELLVDPARLVGDVKAPGPRVGHSMVSCGDHRLYMFGGYSLEQGLLNDMWCYDTLSGSWQLLDTNLPRPKGRYHHAAACEPGRRQIFIYGGFLEPDRMKIRMDNSRESSAQPTNELLIFNIDNSIWEKSMTPPWMPPLVGHTLTYVGDSRLILIGGFSSQVYFSNKVYEYNANSALLNWQEFPPEKMGGAYPIGLYGHSAVYNQASDTVYVYGGYLFRAGRWFVSRELYTYDVRQREWNLLMIQSPDVPPSDPHDNEKEAVSWEGRVFHTAVGLGREMIIIGGLMDDGSYAMDLLVYRYHCNTWHRIQFAQFEREQKTITVMGVRAVTEGGHIYMFGGFMGNMVGTLSRLTLPEDICAIFSHDECVKTLGCHVCGNATAGVCFTAGTHIKRPSQCPMQHSSETAKQCSVLWFQNQTCSRFKSCSQCLSKYPQFKHVDQRCQWCTNCPKGACVRMKDSCPKDNSCPLDQHVISRVDTCFEYLCPASDCQMCSHLTKCLWTRHFKRSSEIGRYYNKDPVYNWNCVSRTLRPTSASSFVGYPPGDCPRRCYQHRSCDKCLLSHGVEGGSQMCMWSEALRECMPPAYLPLRCSFGECGYMLGDSSAYRCPVPCRMKQQCAHCISTPGCGWCAQVGKNGEGVCMGGGLAGPSTGTCTEGSIYSGTNLQWDFKECPTENECTNGHHTCDEKTQDCFDTLTSFRCECKEGYIRTPSGRCEPVCHQGCMEGVCVRPDKCECNFGWVGDNCSTECQCHKHSNCVSVAKKDVCIKCENNTMGRQCEMCRPFFVGDPKTGEPCVPCREYCFNHTVVCVSRDENEVRMMGSQRVMGSQLHKIEPQQRGPSKKDAMCQNCQHNTTGNRCQECTEGHFRRPDDPTTQPCMPCQCNGHSNKCSRDTGENCACQNNTETNCDSKDGGPQGCWQLQCSRCKEYFLGTPTNGHQCYRQMQVDSEYCLDPNSQTDCLHDPVALLPGRTVFYAVQPKYLNVDIRITIDITQGDADVYFSNREDMFQVFVNSMNGIHTVNVDPQYKVDIAKHPPLDASSRHKRSTKDISAFGEYRFEHVRASSLNTYITITEKNSILVVRNVRFRLVITLPEKDHNLRVSRFYIIVQSREREGTGGDKTYGILYFRQDQPHIDLFVFFSVFFSCFFLFLALCVMLWKVKQAFDARRSRQLREREMECMASRPFAKVLVLLEPDDGLGDSDHFGVGLDGFSFNLGGGGGNTFMSTIYNRRGRLSRPMLRLHPHHPHHHPHLHPHPMELSPGHHVPPHAPSRTHHPHHHHHPHHPLSVVPIAVEPTDDGVAAVGTVLFQLPGAWQAPCKLCMGSTLTLRITPPQLAHKPLQRRRPSFSPC